MVFMDRTRSRLEHLLRRWAIALVALMCLVSANYAVRPGVPTPPAIKVLACEQESEHRTDVTPVLRIVALRRAADPVRSSRPPQPPVVHTPAAPQPRGPPAGHPTARGPPIEA
jgi:hypothetical protein